MLDELKEDLVGIDIRFDEPLKRYTYTKVGGPADYLAFPRNRYELFRIVKFANKHNIPWMVLGNASNLIVRDGGIRGFVIMFDKLNGIAVNGYQVEAEAGANLIATTKVACFHSLTGFEFAAGLHISWFLLRFLQKTVIFVRLMQEICVLVIVVRCSKKQVKWLFQQSLTSNQETTNKSNMR